MSIREDLLKRRAGLSAGKQALLKKRLSLAEVEPVQPMLPPIIKRATTAAIPLSFAQQRLWFIQELEPENPFYNELTAVRLSGPLNLPALTAAIREVVRRHEILRTTFSRHDGQIVQQVDPELHTCFDLPLIDFQETPQAQREEEVQQYARLCARQPFDLTGGVLWRIMLLRVSSTDHVVVAIVHHLICDGWSMSLFVRDLGLYYAAACRGDHAPLPDLSLQYADYVLWQHQWIQGSALAEQLAYWRKQLAGIPAMLELPTDHPRTALPGHRGGRLAIHLPPSLRLALNTLAQREGVTLFMLLTTALAIVLARYSHQEDIAIGTPIAGRTHADLEPIFGLFLNTLVIRTDLSGDPTIQQLLHRVRTVALEAYAHQELPFEKLVEELHPQRSLSHSPFFQVTLSLQHMPEPQRLENLTFTPFEVDNGKAKFDLTLLLQEKEQELGGELEYNQDLWDAETMQRFLAHWLRVLQVMSANPHNHLSQIMLLSSQEHALLLEEWNATQAPLPAQPMAHLQIEAQVEHTPDAIALVFEEQMLTYRVLNRRANQLAHRLRQLGVGPEALVGIYMDRSIEQILSMLAILKAGGAYIPLDPSYPQERIAFMLQDSATSLLLTRESLRTHLSAYTGQLLCVESDPSLANQSQENLPCVIEPENAMYMLYTSGSTGRPKGSLNTHRNVYNYLSWQIEQAGITERDRVLLKTLVSFDASALESFTPLMSGATMVIARPEGHRDSAYLVDIIRTQAVSVTHFVPSVLQLFLDEPRVEECRSLRYIVSGGEALSSQLQQRFSSLLHAQIHNQYGPTETSVSSTAWFYQEESDQTSVPIGRPVHNTQILLLDQHLQLVPVGVAGELYIGGVGLARGYFKRPDLTAERFCPHPFSQEPGARLYRTGDLARYRRDGVIEYLGRTDHQVKLRGMRIELGEIESVLRLYQDVQDAAVAVHQDQQGEQRLVAYLITEQEEALPLNPLRAFLQEHLPIHMVPAFFIQLAAFPLTPNGKLDRRALPAPDVAQVAHSGERVAPRTATEEKLAAIWSQLLSVERLSIHDNFFAIGGHSLLATRMLFRVQETFQVELPLRRIFEAPILAEFAASIDEMQAQASPSQALLLPMPRPEHLPLSFAQQRLWILDQLIGAGAAYTVALGVRLEGLLHKEALQAAFNAMVARHEILRTSFITIDAEPFQFVHPQQTLPLREVTLTSEGEEARQAEAQQLMNIEAKRPFNLQEGALTRVFLYPINPHTHDFLLTQHHIITDGWSSELFFKELFAFYQSFVMKTPPALPVQKLQYADYALWQRQWLQGEWREKMLTYWRQQLAGVPDVLELPTDHPREEAPSHQGAQLPFVLSEELTRALRLLAQQEGITLFVLLLASFALLLARHSRQEDLVIGTPIAGRTHAGVEQLLGLFVNTLALRIDLTGDPTGSELLQRIKTVALDGYAHQELPFEQLIEALQPVQNLGQNPLFQAMFVLQNQRSEVFGNGELTMRPLPISNGGTKVDLTLQAEEQGPRIIGYFEYSSALWEQSTLERFLDQWQRILQALATNPQQRLSRIAILSPQERHMLLEEWNATAHPLPVQQIVHLQIEAQAASVPGATALIFEGQTLTYRELNQRANQLAHRLRQLGVGPEVLVGVYMERSLELVIALLAILKAGGAYVPLDPGYPPERIVYMLQDCQSPVLLTQERLRATIPDYNGYVLCVASDLSLMQQSEENIPWQGNLAQAAYMIYTSGSTGRPKGAVNTHQGLYNRLLWMQDRYHLTGQDRVLQKTPYSFDVSVWEFFWPLQVGATLVIARPEGHRDSAYLVQLITEQQVTVLHFVPSMLQVFLEEQHVEHCRSLRHVICSGEALPYELQQRFFARLGAELHNLYGPTEASIDVTSWACQRLSQETIVPIGCPIYNTQILILDHYGQPAPIGVAGELYIGGIGLARGYFNRPDLTAERFLPHPFSSEPGARLYNTGDLARYRHDGAIEYLGRTDHQVKLRGLRIELGEIESVLRHCQGVRDAVVIVHQDGQGEKRLVAYLLMQQELSTEALRAHLMEELPDYMVPSAFVALDTFPLTPSGKLDRRALPAPDLAQAAHSSNLVAPRTPTEEKLAAIWSQLLGVEQVSIYDSFFAIGGHSLLATRLALRLREQFTVELPLRRLFEASTLAIMAQAIDALLPGGTTQVAISQERAWYEDAVLDPSILVDETLRPASHRPSTASGIFLTGATGFLGTHLLYELLQQTRADIYCLVRASSLEQARQKLYQQLAAYQLWQENIDTSRIIPVPGDLAAPLLGLSERRFYQLAKQVEVIYHNGASVNLVAPYQVLKAANVLGTQEVLRLACAGSVKPVYYVSTISVLATDVETEGQMITEDVSLEAQRDHLEGGYPQSKWVAEKLVQQANQRGIPTYIYRPGRISGHAETGAWNPDDYLCRMMRGCIQLGAVPDVEQNIEMTPVDYMSQAIIHLSERATTPGTVFHLFNSRPITISELATSIRSFGYALRRISYDEWRETLQRLTQEMPEHALAPLLLFFPEKPSSESVDNTALHTLFATTNTQEGLAEMARAYPSSHEQLIHTYLSYFVQCGLLPAPSVLSHD